MTTEGRLFNVPFERRLVTVLDEAVDLEEFDRGAPKPAGGALTGTEIWGHFHKLLKVERNSKKL